MGAKAASAESGGSKGARRGEQGEAEREMIQLREGREGKEDAECVIGCAKVSSLASTPLPQVSIEPVWHLAGVAKCPSPQVSIQSPTLPSLRHRSCRSGTRQASPSSLPLFPPPLRYLSSPSGTSREWPSASRWTRARSDASCSSTRGECSRNWSHGPTSRCEQPRASYIFCEDATPAQWQTHTHPERLFTRCSPGAPYPRP